MKTWTAGRADSVGGDGFGFRQVSTESAAGISASEAYPRASIDVHGWQRRWFNATCRALFLIAYSQCYRIILDAREASVNLSKVRQSHEHA